MRTSWRSVSSSVLSGGVPLLQQVPPFTVLAGPAGPVESGGRRNQAWNEVPVASGRGHFIACRVLEIASRTRLS